MGRGSVNRMVTRAYAQAVEDDFASDLSNMSIVSYYFI